MQLNPVAIFADQKEPLAVDPRLPNGDPDTKAVVTFTSSDDTQVGIEVGEDDRSCFCTTPLDAGSATVTISATGYESDTIVISYTQPVPRSLNTTVGVPVSDI